IQDSDPNTGPFDVNVPKVNKTERSDRYKTGLISMEDGNEGVAQAFAEFVFSMEIAEVALQQMVVERKCTPGCRTCVQIFGQALVTTGTLNQFHQLGVGAVHN